MKAGHKSNCWLLSLFVFLLRQAASSEPLTVGAVSFECTCKVLHVRAQQLMQDWDKHPLPPPLYCTYLLSTWSSHTATHVKTGTSSCFACFSPNTKDCMYGCWESISQQLCVTTFLDDTVRGEALSFCPPPQSNNQFICWFWKQTWATFP